MAIEEMFNELPTVSSAAMSDIICAVQGYISPSNLGTSVQETLQQVYTLFQSNIILFNSGDPNGSVAGSTYQFCWDTLNKTLWLCVTSGTTSTAVWIRADINDGYATTVTAAGTTTLTIISPYWQFFTGSTTQTVVMPVATTLAAGITWSIVNNSSGAVTVQSSGLNTITTIPAGSVALVTCILASGTSAASWNATTSSISGGVTSITGTANQIIASASTGAVTLSTPQNINTTSNVVFNSLQLTTPLASNYGGTGVNNAANTATFSGNLNFANSFTTSGNFAVTQTYTGATNVTFPTSGTLATTIATTTWIPIVTFDVPGDISVVYARQFGFYSRVGNIVQVHYDLAFTPTFTTSTGNLRITGLPVALRADAQAFGSLLIQSATFPAGCTSVFSQAVDGATYFVIGADGSGVPAEYFTVTEFTSGGNYFLIGSFSYTV